MIASIISSMLEIFIGTILPKIIRKESDRVRTEKRLQDAFIRYQEGVGSAARIRDVERKEDEELARKWEEKWGASSQPVQPTQPTQPEPQSVPENVEVKIFAPDRVKKNEGFLVSIPTARVGDELFADGYSLQVIGTRTAIPVVLNTAGSRKLRLMREGVELAFLTIEVI